MKLTKINDIYQLSFLPTLFPVNCYLVEEKDSLTLIDTALPFCVNGIMKAANNIGKPITRVLLTHAHEDHVGGLDMLKNKLPNLRVSMSKRDEKLLQGDTSLEEGEGNLPIKGGIPKNIETRVDQYINEGDTVGSIYVISTPGHTPGHLSFLDTRSNSVIVGDAFQTRGGVAVSGKMKVLFPFPAMATWNKKLALESAMKIKSFKPNLLAVGHGKMISNPLPIIEKSIIEAQKKIDQLEKEEVVCHQE